MKRLINSVGDDSFALPGYADIECFSIAKCQQYAEELKLTFCLDIPPTFDDQTLSERCNVLVRLTKEIEAECITNDDDRSTNLSAREELAQAKSFLRQARSRLAQRRSFGIRASGSFEENAVLAALSWVWYAQRMVRHADRS